MPRTTPTYTEFRERLRYLIDRAFARETAGRLLLFTVLVIGVTLYGTTAIFFGLFGPENQHVDGIPREIDAGWADAAWWTIGYIVRLPAFEEMYGASAPILFYAVTLSIMGLAVFGVLVSLINNGMRRRIELLQQGDTPVKERGHVLILGWNNKVFAVLRQLARLRPRARVVILAGIGVREMSDALRVAGVPALPIAVILRTGVPSSRAELERVAVDHASAVILLSDGEDDSEAIKTLVLLATFGGWAGARPNLSAEVALEQNFELAEIGARNRLDIVSSSRVTSKVIVQTIRNPGLARVYDELMSLDGNSLYVQDGPQGVETTIGELAYQYPSAIPIGVTWAEGDALTPQHKAGLNPEPDYDPADDEQLVLLTPRVPAHHDPTLDERASEIYREREARAQAPQRVLFIGWSTNLYDILREVDAHSVHGTEVTVLTQLPLEELTSRLEDGARVTLANLKLDLRSGDATVRATYADMEVAGFDSLVVLADETEHEDHRDTRALRVLLRLSELDDFSAEAANIVVELLDGGSRELFTGLGVRDIVVSSEVISAQLAQISQMKVLGSIYRELLSAGGVEISLRSAGEYVATGVECRFDDLVYAAQRNLEIALGLFLADGDVLLNPSRDLRWTLDEADRVIVLAQEIYV